MGINNIWKVDMDKYEEMGTTREFGKLYSESMLYLRMRMFRNLAEER